MNTKPNERTEMVESYAHAAFQGTKTRPSVESDDGQAVVKAALRKLNSGKMFGQTEIGKAVQMAVRDSFDAGDVY